MNAITRDELIEVVSELRATFPEMRFAQLVLNIADAAGASEPGEVWNVEDDAFLDAARRLLANNRNRVES
jgi:hypothetical protein